jgi:alkanesulfonate monooxygenase SsuD/methylene tetrahydromethanopterin reductase-like flavin-dependent oxidoreductase (luciferase family)
MTGPGAVRVGVDVHDWVLRSGPAERRDLLDHVADAGLDHVGVGDHVSFQGGGGFDGMVSAAAALAATDRLDVWIAIYQAALRHPLTVARQLSSLAEMGPGRLVLGVGVGGEDRREVSNCGVDPRTRGRRLDECLEVLAALGPGEPVDHEGEFFRLEQAAVVPAPQPPAPIVVGGTSEAAIERAARYGDGWLGIFCSPRRFGVTARSLAERAAAHGREVGWLGMQLWCGLDDDPARAREMVADRMTGLYGLPYDKLEHLAPAGTPEQVADFLMPYVEAGARHITVLGVARDPRAGIDHAAEVRRHLIEAGAA